MSNRNANITFEKKMLYPNQTVLMCNTFHNYEIPRTVLRARCQQCDQQQAKKKCRIIIPSTMFKIKLFVTFPVLCTVFFLLLLLFSENCKPLNFEEVICLNKLCVQNTILVIQYRRDVTFFFFNIRIRMLASRGNRAFMKFPPELVHNFIGRGAG